MKPLENRGNPKGALVSPYTQACVNHLHSFGPSTLAQLNAMLGGVGEWSMLAKSLTTESSVRLLRLMHKLREGGHVHRVLRDDVILWVHGPNPATVCQQAQVPAPAPTAAPLVPPPRIDLMRAPLYVPDAGPAMRPGALNFKACASVGQRC